VNVLVTGGTSGLGSATAGATVALTGRSAPRANSVAAELPNAVGIGLDVREEVSVAGRSCGS
jgi:NADP-dependent 3-hydroxy acid dehydrogenase YdfG